MQIIRSAVTGVTRHESLLEQRAFIAQSDAAATIRKMESIDGGIVDGEGRVDTLHARQSDRIVFAKEAVVRAQDQSAVYADRSDRLSVETKEEIVAQAAPAERDNALFASWQHRITQLRHTQQSELELGGYAVDETGRRVDFSLKLQLEGDYFSRKEVIGLIVDPLVVNYAAPSARLSGETFEFNLNGGGPLSRFAVPEAGSAFLAHDANNDGRVNDASELFGMRTGDGFGELAAHDADKSGWIDAADPVYESLFLWIQHDGQDRLVGLREAGIGALSLSAYDTPYTLRDLDTGVLGQIRQSGLFIRTNGDIGTVQQVDLAYLSPLSSGRLADGSIDPQTVQETAQTPAPHADPRKNEKGEWRTDMTYLKIERQDEALILSEYRHASKIYEAAAAGEAQTLSKPKQSDDRGKLGERLRALEGELMRTEFSGVGDETRIRRLKSEIAQTRQQVSAAEFRTLIVQGAALSLKV